MTAPCAAPFAAAMKAFDPFEPAPRLAVAVSGGADSMALALLAHRWARARRGEIVALTVDHRLRPESTAETRAVGRWLKPFGIRHVCLTWGHETPPDAATGGANLQARARAARYRLLSDWCLRHGVLHLLVAHQQDDQAETLLLRLARGSGVDGLAAMAPVAHGEAVRVLRPLLEIPHSALEAMLRRLGQAWIEDPSNRNARFARVRMRALKESLAEEGMTPERLSETAARLRRARASLEAAAAGVLARAATPFELGFVRLDRAQMLDVPEDVALRLLARLVTAVGGSPYIPRREGTERVLSTLRAAEMRPRAGTNDRVLATLGGALIVAENPATFLVVREPSAVAGPVPLPIADECRWDGRFRVRYQRGWARRLPGLSVGPLGESAARLLLNREGDSSPLASVPRRARSTLPALFDANGRLVGLPAYSGSCGRNRSDADSLPVDARFAPALPLVGPGFMLV